ncbi:hypothetical protein [Pseudomonas boanensis]|uniref:hypothetical protein n=1 Tax=Metapseudomonas boanensis TaxID=2822138 RepID=UPI0035D473AC
MLLADISANRQSSGFRFQVSGFKGVTGGIDHIHVEGNVNNTAADIQIDRVGHITLTANDFVRLLSPPLR